MQQKQEETSTTTKARMNKNKGVPTGEVGKYLLKFAESGKPGIKIPKNRGFTVKQMKKAVERYPDINVVVTERDGFVFLLNMNLIRPK
jgi:hypothetical protein